MRRILESWYHATKNVFPQNTQRNLSHFNAMRLIYENNNYLFGQISNVHQKSVYFNMPSNVTVDNKGAKNVPIKTNWK